MAWVCPQCRTAIKNSDQFCRSCGTALSSVPGQSSPSSASGSRAVGWGLAALLISGAILGGGWMFTKAFQSAQNQIGFAAGNDDFNQAAGLYNSKDYKNAAVAFRKVRLSTTATGVVIQKATDGEVYCYRELGHAAQNQSDWNTALFYYQQALSIKPNDVQAKTEFDAARKIADATLPNPPSDATPGPDRTTEFPRRAAPGTPNLSANDFTRKNNQLAEDAQNLFQQGEQALQNGDQAGALKLWAAAVARGPGSPAAQQAQQRLTQYAENNNPFDQMR
jgi:tetratricopeptide (TPR) repeat protein